MADWLTAAGGFLAVFAAVVAWRVSARLLDREERRERKASIAAKRAQAELIFVMGAKLPDRDGAEQWGLFLVNASSKPVFEVVVESQKLDGSATNRPLHLGALPPGKFVVASHPTYYWGSLLEYERLTERVDLLVKGKGREMVQSVDFLDSTRQPWRLVNGTQLSEPSPEE